MQHETLHSLRGRGGAQLPVRYNGQCAQFRRGNIVEQDVVDVNSIPENKEQENYFLPDDGKLEFFSTGSTLLDCCLNGGWAERRMFNLMGNKMSNKSGFCLEACINFKIKHPEGRVVYIETEAATNLAHAAEIGLHFNGDDVRLIEDITGIEEVYNKILELSGVLDER